MLYFNIHYYCILAYIIRGHVTIVVLIYV